MQPLLFSRLNNYVFVGLILFSSCQLKKARTFPSSHNKEFKTIDIQPFNGMPDKEVASLVSEIKKVIPIIVVKSPIPLPVSAYNFARHRYRADSLIRYLHHRTPEDHICIGLTNKDISTTKNGIADWGVMGLGYSPGNACIASSFRLQKSRKTDQLFKVAIHELGHTQGLPHCPVKTCFMRDAEGGNPTNEEKEFCPSCKQTLVKKGWQL